MGHAATRQPESPDWYRIRVQGRLDPRWAARFDGMTLTSGSDGVTVIRGPVADQAALHGVLQLIRDLGTPLISVTREQPDPRRRPPAHADNPTLGD